MAEDPGIRKRRKSLEKVLKSYQLWTSLVESQGLHVINVAGEEFHYMDILGGLMALPPRQREAVWLMCVEDRSEADVAVLMGFPNKNCTPVQQYKAFGLTRLLEYQDSSPAQREVLTAKVQKYGRKKKEKTQ